MKILFRFFIALCCFMPVGFAAAADLNLSGSVSLNITSDTAANAKDMAFEEARRQIISEALSQYANTEQLQQAIDSAASQDLVNLVASSGIEGEKLSDTTYSATISMVLDTGATKQWLTDNNVQNWLNDGEFESKFITLIALPDKMSGWIELNRIARQEKLDLTTKYIMGNQVIVELPVVSRAKFTIAVREAGWRYSDQDGVLRIWK